MFGLSVVAEFFRRDGWDVVGGVAGTDIDPAQWVREERFDVVGLSVGSELKLPWLSERIAAVRRASCNPDLVVMVGGPVFSADPANVQRVGADLTSGADTAPAMAEEFLMRKASAAQQPPSSRCQP